MENNQEQIIKEQMKQYGVELEINPSFQLEGNILSVECDVDVILDLPWINQAVLTKITKRGTKMYVNFRQQPNKLVIVFSSLVPKEYSNYRNNVSTKFCTTFPDFCWLHGEGTTAKNIIEVETIPRDQELFVPGDLLWSLPSRFADDLIELVHTINPDFMSGLMQDCIVYGPYYNQV